MWRHVYFFSMFTLFWSQALSEDCYTPLGSYSQCVSWSDCPAMQAVINQNPTSPYVRSFIRQSLCGYQGATPKVCCGPIPYHEPRKRLTSAVGIGKGRDEYSTEDSFPASREQCGIDTDGDRIYGGKNAETNDFPWMALLGYKNSKGITQYKCGGSLINRRYVLSAAHCLIGYDKEIFGPLTSVRLGEHDISANPEMYCPYENCGSRRRQEIAVASAHAHPRYDSLVKSRHHDIALVRLTERAIYTSYVRPICLVYNDELPKTGVSAMVAGWGETLQTAASAVKQKLTVLIFDKDTCAKKFQSINIFLGDGQFCAGGIFKQDTCRGDSGGPLMIKSPANKWEAIGVVSSGRRHCGLDGWPGVYTSVGRYLSWIRETLRSTNH